jgi:hypothetical protein
MKNKNIKELLLIAEELDKRSLFSESDIIYKLAADIIDFEERASALRGKEDSNEPVEQGELAEVIEFPRKQNSGLRDYLGDYTEEEIDGALEFIESSLSPESKVYHMGDDADQLIDFAHNDSQELRDYMLEVIPDKLVDLSVDTGEADMGEVLRLVKDVAESLPKYEDDDDFKYIIDAMSFYMSDYIF